PCVTMIVEKGKQQCQCPEGLVFSAAKNLCRVAPPRAGGQAKMGDPSWMVRGQGGASWQHRRDSV
ncbi:unnamed protein product, partial [Closterium sp. Naga37s-1]